MCYNVLCDKYCTRQLYGYCPSWALDWEYRKVSIMKEILHYGADIVSLQVSSEIYSVSTCDCKLQDLLQNIDCKTAPTFS